MYQDPYNMAKQPLNIHIQRPSCVTETFVCGSGDTCGSSSAAVAKIELARAKDSLSFKYSGQTILLTPPADTSDVYVFIDAASKYTVKYAERTHLIPPLSPFACELPLLDPPLAATPPAVPNPGPDLKLGAKFTYKEHLELNVDDDENHYFTHMSRSDGEKEVAKLAAAVTKEELWVFIKYEFKGTTHETWIETGKVSSETRVQSGDAYTVIMSVLGNVDVSVSELTIAHLHPGGKMIDGSTASGFMSGADIESTLTWKGILKDLGYSGAFDEKAISPLGIYTITPDPSLAGLSSYQYVARGTLANATYDAWVDTNKMDLRFEDQVVAAANQLRVVVVSFTYHSPETQKIIDAYKTYAKLTHKLIDESSHRLRKFGILEAEALLNELVANEREFKEGITAVPKVGVIPKFIKAFSDELEWITYYKDQLARFCSPPIVIELVKMLQSDDYKLPNAEVIAGKLLAEGKASDLPRAVKLLAVRAWQKKIRLAAGGYLPEIFNANTYDEFLTQLGLVRDAALPAITAKVDAATVRAATLPKPSLSEEMLIAYLEKRSVANWSVIAGKIIATTEGEKPSRLDVLKIIAIRKWQQDIKLRSGGTLPVKYDTIVFADFLKVIGFDKPDKVTIQMVDESIAKIPLTLPPPIAGRGMTEKELVDFLAKPDGIALTAARKKEAIGEAASVLDALKSYAVLKWKEEIRKGNGGILPPVYDTASFDLFMKALKLDPLTADIGQVNLAIANIK